jgi:hypothetical protein
MSHDLYRAIEQSVTNDLKERGFKINKTDRSSAVINYCLKGYFTLIFWWNPKPHITVHGHGTNKQHHGGVDLADPLAMDKLTAILTAGIQELEDATAQTETDTIIDQ